MLFHSMYTTYSVSQSFQLDGLLAVTLGWLSINALKLGYNISAM